MIASRNIPLFSLNSFCLALLAWGAGGPTAKAMAPSGQAWLTISTPHFRIHHTPPLESYARSVARTLEHVLPEIESRLSWKAPEAIDVIVEDPYDFANGLTMNFPNNSIELYATPFPSDSTLGYYQNWVNEIATHELTHMVANDTTRGFYQTLRAIFGSWVKPNGIEPVWLSEGLAVFEETSLSNGGRGRSPLLEAVLREAVLERKLTASDYTSLDRFNEGVPWWPAGNTPYLMGYTIQALPTNLSPNLPGKYSHENADTILFAPDRTLHAVNGKSWDEIWAGATDRLSQRYPGPAGAALDCRLTSSGNFTGGQAAAADGWIYFSEQDWDRGYHLARVRANAPCGNAEVERLTRSKYSGPTQVAVSPSGKTVAFSALDPGFETEYADLYLWSEANGRERLTRDGRVRDPAFLDEKTLLYVRAGADTSEGLVSRNLGTGEERVLWTSPPLQQISGLFARGKHIVFALHSNDGHQKIMNLMGSVPAVVVKTMDKDREFERNPFLTADGTLYFAAAYGHGAQAIYRFDAVSGNAVLALSGASGFVDRPVLLPDGKTLVVENYGLHGLDLYRASLGADQIANPVPRDDLHEFLTGEPPHAIASNEVAPVPASEPYNLGTSATSLWPHYWFPQGAIGQGGVILGASTSGNDALNYQRWSAAADWDSRANFPLFDAAYTNRAHEVAFHLEARQTNNYFYSEESSNRNTLYSGEFTVPAWDFLFSFGAAYRDKTFFGARSNSWLGYQNIFINQSGGTPASISPNWGWNFDNLTAVYPATYLEQSFVTVQPALTGYTRGILPSHSVSLRLAAGYGTNQFLASNYFLGGGATALGAANYVVRGYPTDALFGEKIATANLAYTLPLADVYRGIGDNPIFLKDFGLRLMADMGTANHLGTYSGHNFTGYERLNFGKRYLSGVGADLLTDASLLYHVPVSLALGGHYGFAPQYGGGWLFYFALNVDLNTGALRAPASAKPEPTLHP